jgi:hypothetical protein
VRAAPTPTRVCLAIVAGYMRSARVLWVSLLVVPLYLSCDSTAPIDPATEIPALPVAAMRGGHGDGALLVGNFVQGGATNSILRYNASTGAFVDVFVPFGSGGLRGVTCCMVFGPDENLYVRRGASVLRYNGATGAFIDEFVPQGSGGLVTALVLVFGPDGNLYVGDVGTQSVRRYNGTTGGFIDEFVKSGSGGLSTGGDPQLFVFGPDGNLYVASQVTHRILRFNGTTGEFMGDFVPAGSGGSDAPSGLTFGRDGNLYVGSTSTDRILRYNGRTGAFIDEFVSAGSGGLDIPVGLVFGPDRNLYVANATGDGSGSVLRYHRRTGSFLDVFVPTGSGGISGPRVILFKPKITMCHRTPGNPDDNETISVGQLSAADHIAHGDLVGACPTWSVPVNLGPIVNTAFADADPFISKDGLSLYFVAGQGRGGSGLRDLWISQRANTNDPWGPPQNLGPTINSAGHDDAPTLSLDGRRLYFASSRPGGFGGFDLYVSRRRDKRDFGWETPVNLGSAINTTADEASATFFEDEVTGTIIMYFNSNRPGGPGLDDIYASTLQPHETFGLPVLVAELSTPFNDRQPAVRRDGLEMFLGSDRPGTIGNTDLWVATRASTADAWSTPVNLGPVVNSPARPPDVEQANDFRPALSFDGASLYFAAALRPGNVGDMMFFDLWVTTRSQPDLDRDDGDDDGDDDDRRRKRRRGEDR